jgi:hypothetical protein
MHLSALSGGDIYLGSGFDTGALLFAIAMFLKHA